MATLAATVLPSMQGFLQEGSRQGLKQIINRILMRGSLQPTVNILLSLGIPDPLDRIRKREEAQEGPSCPIEHNVYACMGCTARMRWNFAGDQHLTEIQWLIK